jgi:hypothetical protein
MTSRLESVEEKIDQILERTRVLEAVAKMVGDHDTVLRGPNKDDGLVTEFPLLKKRQDDLEKEQAETDGKIDTLIKDQKETQRENRRTLITVAIAFGVPLTSFIGLFVWGLWIHTITLTMGH